ncbi:MAG: hypothetical protein KF868_09145 [Acidobacteria bacterium]|nr:hypothetical protein [Acidobacteriota bacterium]
MAIFGSCAKPDAETGKSAALASARARLRGCAPDPEQEKGALRLAVGAVERIDNSTRVRLVGYAVGDDADFALPVYLLSRGRWLVEERARVYLLDSDCREYKLKDRIDAPGQKVPDDGRVRLRAGEARETVLLFPRLRDGVREGAIVYGKRVIAFSMLLDAE